jgi:vancomycin resistance protein YoaR
MPRHVRTSPRPRWLAPLLAATVVVAVLGVVAAAWAVDTSGADAVRNLTVAGRDVGRASPDEVRATLAELADDYREAEVRIVVDDDTYDTTAGQLGLSLDEEATLDAVLDEGSTGVAVLRPFAWLWSFVDERETAPRFDVDLDRLERELRSLEGHDRVEPVEPRLVAGGTGVAAQGGRAGRGIDPTTFARSLRAAAASGDTPIVVDAARVAIASRFSDTDARALADQANEMSESTITIAVGDQATQLAPATYREWFVADTSGETLVLAIDHAAMVAGLRALLPDVEQPPVDASFDVVGGTPVVLAGQDGRACCAADSGQRLLDALAAGQTSVDVDELLTPPTLTTDEANALGIVEEVGQPEAFGPTTRHACCQPRVENIHRIADIVRGHVILPGETFSVNGFVGERTTAKGFVDAPVIYQGRFESDIGGGVSQFATTLFNAAFFAGLDFGEYQSHSIQIDRYPRGREATISFPHPDLEIVNSTAYGVLVWPTYTDSSITVHLYSTHVVDVDAGATSDSRQGNCTRVTQPRTRRYTDGRVEADSVFAVYRPGEGVNC